MFSTVDVSYTQMQSNIVYLHFFNMVLSVHKWLIYIFQNYEILIVRHTLSLDLEDNVGMNSHLTTLRGTLGGPEHRNTAKKLNKHRITERKFDETPSPQYIFSYLLTKTAWHWKLKRIKD